jgi:AcrR family transcriptional regulator
MGIKERRLREKVEIKSTILDAGWKLVKEDGWQSLSIRKIADAIEYSIPVIYDHFENKEAILEEFGKNGFRLLTQKLKRARDKHLDPAGQLMAIANAYWDFALKNREYYQLMYGVGMACCESGNCMSDQEDLRGLIAKPITDLIIKGKHPNANPCLKYHTYCSILHGLISIRMTGTLEVSDQLNKLVVEGCHRRIHKALPDFPTPICPAIFKIPTKMKC